VNLKRRMMEGLLIALGAAMIAALVHIVAILVIPMYASRDAFARLSQLGPVNETILLPQPGPGTRLIPYGDPAVASSFCRFDLNAGPLRVKAAADPAGFASLSFHTRRGSIFYAITDKAATHATLDALVLTEDQLRALAAKDDEDTPVQELRIVSPSNAGFVAMRSFSEQPSLYPHAESAVKMLTCASEPIPE
jgi:uncharacterized membrane protein